MIHHIINGIILFPRLYDNFIPKIFTSYRLINAITTRSLFVRSKRCNFSSRTFSFL